MAENTKNTQDQDTTVDQVVEVKTPNGNFQVYRTGRHPDVPEHLYNEAQRHLSNLIHSHLAPSPALAELVSCFRTVVRTNRAAHSLENDYIRKTYDPSPKSLDDLKNEFRQNGWLLSVSAVNYLLFTKGMDPNRLARDPMAPFIATASLEIEDDQYVLIATGDDLANQEAESYCKKHLPVIENKFHSYYMDGNSLGIRMSQQKSTRKAHALDIFYPWLERTRKNSVAEFVDDYLASKEAVLLLAGPPGTGKSTLVAEIISRCKGSIGVCEDSEVADQHLNELITSLVNKEIDILIVEDADRVIKGTRKDGNKNIARILNVIDGIRDNNDEREHPMKIVFTTNILEHSDIDEALLRKGRTYSAIMFELFPTEYAVEVAKVINPEFKPSDGVDYYSLADIAHYNPDRIDDEIRGESNSIIGFIRSFVDAVTSSSEVKIPKRTRRSTRSKPKA